MSRATVSNSGRALAVNSFRVIVTVFRPSGVFLRGLDLIPFFLMNFFCTSDVIFVTGKFTRLFLPPESRVQNVIHRIWKIKEVFSVWQL